MASERPMQRQGFYRERCTLISSGISATLSLRGLRGVLKCSLRLFCNPRPLCLGYVPERVHTSLRAFLDLSNGARRVCPSWRVECTLLFVWRKYPLFGVTQMLALLKHDAMEETLRSPGRSSFTKSYPCMKINPFLLWGFRLTVQVCGVCSCHPRLWSAEEARQCKGKKSSKNPQNRCVSLKELWKNSGCVGGGLLCPWS